MQPPLPITTLSEVKLTATKKAPPQNEKIFFLLVLSLLLASYNQRAFAQLAFNAAANYGVGTAPFGTATADFNGDGKLDIAIGNSGSGDVSVLFGNGNGSFGTASNFRLNARRL